jgi:hypothetical protein
MGKMNILTGKYAAVFREKLHRRLDALSPKARLATVAVMSAAFAAGCLYMTATAIAGFGKGNGTMEIRHMKKPELPQKADLQEAYEHYHKNRMYGKGTEKE